MQKIDWQAYLDGSLTPEEYEIAEQQLQSDPAAQRSVAGLREFRDSIKSASLADPVPTDRLQRGLSDMVKANKTPWFSRPSVLVPTAVAACVVTGIAIFSTPTSPASTGAPTVAMNGATAPDLLLSDYQAGMAVDSPEEAAEFVSGLLYRPAPVVTLANVQGANFDSAECGYCWIAYKFSYEGEKYTLFGRKQDTRFGKMFSEQLAGKTVYYFEDSIGWRCAGDMDYVLKGGTFEGRQTIAAEAVHETPHLVAAF